MKTKLLFFRRHYLEYSDTICSQGREQTREFSLLYRKESFIPRDVSHIQEIVTWQTKLVLRERDLSRNKEKLGLISRCISTIEISGYEMLELGTLINALV